MRLLLALSLLLFGLAPGASAFQEVDTQNPEEAREAAQARLAELGDDEAGKAWREAVQERIRLLDELLATRRERADLPAAESLALRLEQANAALEALRAEDATADVQLAAADEVTTFEQVVGNAEARETTARTVYEELKERRTRGEAELHELPQREAGAEARAAEPGEDELASYRVGNARLEKLVAQERQVLLTEGRVRWEQLEAVLEAELELAGLELARAQARLGVAREQADQLREVEAESARQEAEAAAAAAERERDPLERFRRRIEAELAAARAEVAEVQTEFQRVAVRLEDEEGTIESLELEEGRLKRRLALRGEGGDLLLERSAEAARRSLKLVEGALLPELYELQAENQTRLAEVLDRLWQVEQPVQDNEILATLLAEAGEGRAEEARRLFDEAADGPEGVGEALRRVQIERERLEERYAKLEELFAEHRERIAEYRDFVEKRRRWVRSFPPIDWAAIKAAGREVVTFTEVARAPATTSRARTAVGSRRPALLGTLMAALVLGVFGYLGSRRVRTLRERPPSTRTVALVENLLALLVAIDVPVILWLLAAFIHTLDDPPEVDPPLARLLEIEAWFVLVRRVLSTLLRPKAWSVRAGWIPPDLAAQARRSVRIVTLGGQFFFAPYLVLTASPFELVHIGRLLEIFWLSSILVSILLVLTKTGAMGRRIVARVPWMGSVWGAVLPLVCAGFLATLVLYALGYGASARHVIHNTGRTAVAIVALAGLYFLLLRIGERMAEQISCRLAFEGESDVAVEARTNGIRVVARVSAIFVVASLALFLQQIWGVGEFSVDLFSRWRIVQLESGEWVTGTNVAFAILWVVAGHFVSHNLARLFHLLIEPLVRQGSRGEQLAWITLGRYAIVAGGWTAALLTLRVDLGTLGWLLTAVSVGLGFGLQEIVANFVSGLILLFEKPIRVGDVITVGQTGGTVDRITIRSTVVTNWERQTIIIPNKNFITQELTNWTRQDETVRRKLKVGVARGTDVERVMRILDDVAEGHPGVMTDPPHKVWFEGYGEYTLDFELWFYATFDEGLRLKTELYTKLVKRLEEEGIEVPVPRHDVHMEGVNTVPGTLSPGSP